MFRYIIRCEKLFKNLIFKRRITASITKLNESKKTDKKYGQTSSVQKILKIKDLVDYLVYGTFGVALYYAYQRYKKWNEIKQELKADLTEIKEFKTKFYKIKDFYFPEDLITSLKEIKEFKTRKEDVWVTSFPKSGTTWLQEIVYLIMNDCDFEKAKSKTIDERSPFIEFPTPGIKYINNLESPRIIKTHLPIEFLPDDIENKSKVVYIVRNPKDTCVSFYHFIKMITHAGYTGNMQDMIRLFIEGKIPYGPWPKHVDSYTSKKNVHLIHYEDLQTNPKETIKSLCQFLDKKIDDSQLDSIISWCSFKNMKQNKSVNYEWNKMLGIFSKEGEFFRKGEIGDWLNYFSLQSSKQIDQLVDTELKYERKFNYGISDDDLNKIYSAANLTNKID